MCAFPEVTRLAELVKEVDQIAWLDLVRVTANFHGVRTSGTDSIDGLTRPRLRLVALKRTQHVVSGSRPARIEGGAGLEEAALLTKPPGPGQRADDRPGGASAKMELTKVVRFRRGGS